nr:Imm52 family immunity protein [Methylovirgula sp. HY1]
MLRHIDLLRQIDPLFASWLSGVSGPKKFETVRNSYAEIIAARISTDDWGEPLPIDGYWFGAITRDQPGSLSYAVNIHAGAHKHTREFQNDAYFSTSSGFIPNPTAVTYRIFRSALFAIVEAWEPTDCIALPHELLGFIGNRNYHFHEVWMQYLSAPLARLITPPQTAIVDHLPNGGLLMSATTETFKVDNPTHLAVARDIAAATEPLNKLPCAHDPNLR